MNNIQVSKFIEEYEKNKTVEARQKYIESCIYRIYAPVMEKRSLLQLMLDKSIINDKEKNRKYIDLMSSKINLTCAVIGLYTNIVPDKNDEGKSLNIEMYDSLMSTGVFEYICNYIGKNEITELTTINNNLISTWREANTSTFAFVDDMTQLFATRFAEVFGVVGKEVIDLINDEAKLKDIINKASKYVKPILKNMK